MFIRLTQKTVAYYKIKLGSHQSLLRGEDVLMFKQIWCIPLGYVSFNVMCSLNQGPDGGCRSLLLEYISIEDDVTLDLVTRLRLNATQSRYLNHIKILFYLWLSLILSGFMSNCQVPCGDMMLSVLPFIFAKINSGDLTEVQKFQKNIVI